MTVHLAGRGVTVPPALRRHIEARVTRVARVLPKATEARVVLAVERHRHLAEVTLQAKGATLHAEAVAGDFPAAVAVALESLEQQARRRKDRIRARKPRPARRAPAATEPGPGAAAEGAEEATPVVVRRLGAKPMSVDEALDQMRVGAKEWLVFRNARTRTVNVLRRRPDGIIELVEPTG